MKTNLLMLSVFFCQFGFSQMTIDLGNDTVFCAPYPDTAQANNTMGSNLVINQGTPPYSYTWSSEPYYFPFSSSIVLHASDYLNDTTIAQPLLLGGRDTMEFVLTVTDANGLTASDSITVYNSQFTIHLGYFIHYILEGDSLFLGCNNIAGGMGPLTYLWRPNHGLLDSTSANFWTKPSVTTAYYPTVTDSVGCMAQAGFGCIVIVDYLNIDEVLNSDKPILIYPNPTTGTIQLKDEENQSKKIQIFDANGRLIADIMPSNFPYDLSGYAKGTYFLKIETEGESVTKTVVLE